jgi:hypothetical protein
MAFCSLQNTYHLIGIKSLAMVVKIANADISVVTRISLNGMQKVFLVILPRFVLYANNQRSNSDDSNSKNCTRYRCTCPFVPLSLEERAACQENAELLTDPGNNIDAELQQNGEKLSLQDQQILPALSFEAPSIEELHLIHFLSSMRPRTQNAGNFDTWKSQIPL